jgi:hypothetical protein
MSTPPTDSTEQPAARTPLSSSELTDACKIDVYDSKGKAHTLGEVIQGKRSVLIFTRHFCKLVAMSAWRGWVVTNIRRVSKLSSLRTGHKPLNTPLEVALQYSEYVLALTLLETKLIVDAQLLSSAMDHISLSIHMPTLPHPFTRYTQTQRAVCMVF